MIATIRFTLDSKGKYAEKKIYFPDVGIIQVAEMIEAYCQGYRVGSNFDAFITGLSTSGGSRDAAFDSKVDSHAIAERLFSLRAGSVSRERVGTDHPKITHVCFEEVGVWHEYTGQSFTPNMFALKFADGWIFDRLAGWRKERP